jgi:hypothetical protein
MALLLIRYAHNEHMTLIANKIQADFNKKVYNAVLNGTTYFRAVRDKAKLLEDKVSIALS